MMESIHTFGLCLMVIEVLPKLDLLRAIMIMCGVGKKSFIKWQKLHCSWHCRALGSQP